MSEELVTQAEAITWLIKRMICVFFIELFDDTAEKLILLLAMDNKDWKQGGLDK